MRPPNWVISGSRGANFVDWPAPERAAAEQAFRALLAIALVDGREPVEMTELIEGIAHATGGMEPWLEYLAGLPGPTADAGLVRLVCDWAIDLLWEELRFSWWYDGDPQVIADWLPTQRARVTAFAARHPHCKTAADALIALDRLQAGDHSAWLYPYGIARLLGAGLMS
ncbi:hypothetical protein OG985_41845 [Streptomyces sp. NBC_00289]|uniref:hypothetical protein n=1 Tax=Streptomyces sp. NBC_00289 TaxID=2975703 RepID=UPI0032458560